MRITAGTYKGRRLTAPKGQEVRPTTDMVRQAIFNILQKYDQPHEADVLDACCGTGALGLEALSRGAAHCLFIDKSRESLTACRDNIAALNAGAYCAVLQRDARKPGTPPAGYIDHKASLLFLDPPYRRGLIKPSLAALANNGWLAPDALCVLETEKQAQDLLPPSFSELEQRPYGDSLVIFARYTAP